MQTRHAKKVILISESGSVLERDLILRELFDDRVELFGAWGIDAEEWADCLEWISVMAGVEEKIDHFIPTYWQQEGQSFEEFMSLAEQIEVPSGSTEIEIIRV
jgi:hypothetical protein